MNRACHSLCLAFAVTTVLLVGILGLGCEHRTRDGSTAPADTTNPLRPTQVSWDVRFTMMKDGRRRAVFTAGRMEQFETEDSTYSVLHSAADTVRVRTYVFNEEGDSSATITANRVVLFDEEGRFEAYGDVVVTTETDKRLSSEHLTWQQADREIRTRRFVRIVTPSEVVRGNGLVADENLETYQIGPLQAEVEVEEDPDDDGGE
jgi:LPS export ABC transporter protein LptC